MEHNKNKLCETLDYGSRDMLNFDFSEKGLGIVSPPHFVYGFSRNMFQEKCYIPLTDQISLSDFLYVLDNMCIAIVCFPGCDVIDYEINLVFL